MAAVPPPIDDVPIDPALADVHLALSLCGLEDEIERNRVIVFEGIETITFLSTLDDDEIDAMADRLRKRVPAATRVNLNALRIKRMKTLVYWIKKTRREGGIVDLTTLNQDRLLTLADEMSMSTVPKKKDEKLFYPDKFDSKNYISWSRSLTNYLDSLTGKSNVPLTYVI